MSDPEPSGPIRLLPVSPPRLLLPASTGGSGTAAANSASAEELSVSSGGEFTLFSSYGGSSSGNRENRDRDEGDSSSGRNGWAGRAIFLVLLLLAIIAGSLTGLLLVYSVDLPQIVDLERYRPNATTELLDIHGRAFGSIALQRRVVAPYEAFPPLLREAVISIEDKNFESHWGVNLVRVAGAAYHDLTSSGRAQGASTLTMQLARDLFLSPQRTFSRKLQEVFLSIQIERTFTKDQIFALYANQIYLGQGVYGFEAGSEYYFSKHAKDLTLSEAALLAGLPKGPVAYSPVLNPERAFRRRNTVINSMLEDGLITAAQANAAKAEPLGLNIQAPPNNVAPWFIEEVRRELEQDFGVQARAAGLHVYTTLDLDLQEASNHAVLDGLASYERTQGWRGHLLNVIAAGGTMDELHHPDWTQDPVAGDYTHALVTNVLPYQVTARIGQRQLILTSDDWAWTKQREATKFLKPGDIIYVHLLPAPDSKLFLRGTLEQDTGVEGSLLAIDNATGEVRAMVGGRDFNLSQFNRATQAERQAGSAFKPYVYATAIEEGAHPDDIVVDSPITFETPGGPYTPRNFDNTFEGPVTLVHAFADSRNIPALKLAARVGIRKVIETAHQFGLESDMPAVLSIALGAADVTLEEQVSAFSSFPNDGIRVAPHLIRRVTNDDNLTLLQTQPEVTESTSVKTAREMMPLFKAVLQYGGTASAADVLKHPLGGKTGTTSNYSDAWFIGFSPSTTCGVWVGYDDHEALGDMETGGHAALPIWMDFMKVAIASKPDERFPGDEPALPAKDFARNPSGVAGDGEDSSPSGERARSGAAPVAKASLPAVNP
ncbi:MAG TPA: PBP1A family penicillin-binding protein [Acidobacteriaceae bacterium]|nr:PBP1A family penicillin-binding protein [Acidobacteriaceae bacterium]